MAPQPSCVQFKETRINFDWNAKGTIVNLEIPSTNSSFDYQNWSSSSPQSDDAESAFARENLAESSSIYFRPLNRYPRVVLWRVVENGRALTLHPVDFSKPSNVRSGAVEQSIKIHFPVPIKDHSVALADGGLSVDELVVYVLLTDKQIYTLRLKPEFWRSPAARKRIPDWCRSYLPSSFTLNNPHFLVAVDGRTCLVTLQNGGLVRLAKNINQVDADASDTKYIESSYNNSLLSTFRQLIPLGSGGISPATIISIAQWTDSAPKPRRLILTVSMSHALKVWSPDAAHALWEGDLANDVNAVSKHPLPSTPRHLVSIIDVAGVDTLFHAVTLCPVSNVFKFWAAKTKPGSSTFLKLVDMYQDGEAQLMASPPNTNSAWVIEKFDVVPTKTPKVFDLWVLWKSNKFSKIQNLRFDLNSAPADWPESTFAASASVSTFPSRGPDDIPSGSDDISDFWEEWILYPDRFPDSVLETALRIYSQSFPPLRPQEANGSLASRIATTLSASVQQPINIRDESLAVNQRQVLGTQWERFARLCAELDRHRHEAQTLAIDPYLSSVWVTYSDMLNVVRNCTEIEFILENLDYFATEPELVSRSLRQLAYSGLKLTEKQAMDILWLIYCATKLNQCFNEVYVDEFKAALQEEVTQDAMFATMDRVQTLFAKMEPQERLPEEVLNGLLDAVSRIGDLYGTFQRVIDYFTFTNNFPRQAELTAFGEKILVSGAQEVVHTSSQTLVNVIYLLVLLTGLGEEYTRTHNVKKALRASDLIVLVEQYFTTVKEYELLSWMSRKKLPDWSDGTEEEALAQELEELAVSGSYIPAEKKSGPILQLLFLDSIGPTLDKDSASKGVSLTNFITEFLTEVHSRDYTDQAVQIATLLLNSRGYEIALDFLRFIPNSYWGTYVKGRIYLANGREELAAMHFKRAAYGLGKARANHGDEGTKSLIDSARINSGFGGMETYLKGDGKMFGEGLAYYYSHILFLFNVRKSYGYALEFATLSLGAFGPLEEKLVSAPLVRQGVLEKGFNAAIEVSAFDDAYQILLQIENAEILKTNLTKLVEAMCTEGQSGKLCSFPYIGLQDMFEEVLEEKCQSQLDIRSGPPYHQILYSWRIERGDFKGAATVLHERLLRVQNAEAGIRDPTARNITDSQLALLNVLHCVGPDDAWVFSSKRVDQSETQEGVPEGGAKRTKLSNGVSPIKVRTVVTLEEIYREYQVELEKNRTLARGGFYLE